MSDDSLFALTILLTPDRQRLTVKIERLFILPEIGVDGSEVCQSAGLARTVLVGTAQRQHLCQHIERLAVIAKRKIDEGHIVEHRRFEALDFQFAAQAESLCVMRDRGLIFAEGSIDHAQIIMGVGLLVLLLKGLPDSQSLREAFERLFVAARLAVSDAKVI